MKRGTVMATGAYRQAQIGGNAVVMVLSLLDAALAALMRAEEARRETHLDIELAELDRVSRIMLGLSSALDRMRGWPLIDRLERFYLTISFHTLAVPRRTDPFDAYGRLARQLRGMRDAWARIAREGAAARGVAAGRDTNVIL